ncbi:hypothetical protein MMC25_006878 [Agyrium rufum]|nr:hypothetical protein [Agyrium rufum]
MADNTRYGKLFEKDHGDELVIRETSSASSLLEENEQRSRDSFLDRRKLYLLGATCAVFLLVNISWTIFLFAHNRPVLDCKPGPDLIYSPVREAVAYETILMNNSIYTTSKFKGEPNAAQDHAWWELSQCKGISPLKIQVETDKIQGKTYSSPKTT